MNTISGAIGRTRTKKLIISLLVPLLLAGCAGNGVMQTDTGQGALLGGGVGAGIGALIDHSNPWAGALIGAAGGALLGGIVGHEMDQRKQDLAKDLAPEINAGQVTVQILPDNAVMVTMTRQTAFMPGSSVVNPGFISTLQKIGKVVKTYGKTMVAVIGHPDDWGSFAEKEAISNQRAEAIRNMFLGMGVSPILVSASGNPNSSYLDGRVEIVINPIRSN